MWTPQHKHKAPEGSEDGTHGLLTLAGWIGNGHSSQEHKDKSDVK